MLLPLHHVDRLYYLAYGSNLHPVRLRERIASARLLGAAELPGYRLTFHMQGEDASGKGNLVVAVGACAYGAVYEIHAAHKPVLDRYEGPGYCCQPLRVALPGGTYDCFVYIAGPGFVNETLRPYDWYQRLVLLGGEYLGLPDSYLAAIRGRAACRDPDASRAALHEALISRMTAMYPRA